MDESALFEAALAEDPTALRILTERIAHDAALHDRWVDHARLAIAVRGLSPRPDLAARVLTVVRVRRPSQRRRIARRVARTVRPPRLALAAVLVVGIAGLGWLLARTPAGSPAPATGANAPAPPVPITPTWQAGTATVLATADQVEVVSGTLELRWPDGSHGRLGPGSAATPGPLTRVQHGRMDLDVRPRQASPFRIAAGETEVEVLGTRFTVERDGATTLIAVSEGRVAVRDRGRAIEIAAHRRLRIDVDGMAGEQLLWSFAPELPLRFGTWDPASAWIASQPWQGDGSNGEACIALRLDVAWSARARARARIHVPRASRVRLQVGIARAWNVAQTHEIPAGWSTVEWAFADLAPYQPQPPLQATARVEELTLILDQTEPMRVAWFEILVPEL